MLLKKKKKNRLMIRNVINELNKTKSYFTGSTCRLSFMIDTKIK